MRRRTSDANSDSCSQKNTSTSNRYTHAIHTNDHFYKWNSLLIPHQQCLLGMHWHFCRCFGFRPSASRAVGSVSAQNCIFRCMPSRAARLIIVKRSWSQFKYPCDPIFKLQQFADSPVSIKTILSLKKIIPEDSSLCFRCRRHREQTVTMFR